MNKGALKQKLLKLKRKTENDKPILSPPKRTKDLLSNIISMNSLISEMGSYSNTENTSEDKGMLNIEGNLDKSKYVKKEVTLDQLKKRKELNEIMSYASELGFGIGQAFKYFSTNGMLYHHKGREEQILEYKDEFGNIVTGKEAFKAHSHAFHGHTGSQKLIEKRKMKALLRNKTDSFGDTPLQSGAALREKLKENETYYLDLTGSNKTVVPYIPVKDTNKEELEVKRKKMLKKVKRTRVKKEKMYKEAVEKETIFS